MSGMSADARRPRHPRRGTGSQAALRAANTQRLVRTLREGGPTTQASLARLTGLSSATVSNLVRALADDGVVLTSATTSSGRRATQVELAATSGAKVAIGVDIGRTHARVVLCTASREIVAEAFRTLPGGHRPADTLDVVDRLVGELLADAGLGREAVVGCGVGIPAPIDTRTGEVAHGSFLPDWLGLGLETHLAERLGVPVQVENDANLGALAEVTWGAHRDARDLVFVKVASGIGAGLVLDGQLYLGAFGVTGELGHTTITEYGPICSCGRRGCLESVASTRAMLALLTASHATSPPSLEDLIRLARDGDPATVRIVEDAGFAIGRVLGGVANLLNPGVVVIGGPLIPLGSILVDSIRQGLSRFCSPVVSAATMVEMSSLDDRAESLGACSLVLRDAPESAWH